MAAELGPDEPAALYEPFVAAGAVGLPFPLAPDIGLALLAAVGH